MRALFVLVPCLAVLSACRGDGVEWSVGAATGGLASLDDCDCGMRDRSVVPPIGRFAVVTCLQSDHGTLSFYLPTPRAARDLVEGFLDVDAATVGPVFAERLMSQRYAIFKGQPTEAPYRVLYVPKLVFEGSARVPAGELKDLKVACDTYLVDDPNSPFQTDTFDGAAP